MEITAGATIISANYDALCKWVLDAVESNQPAPHGKKYTQQFIAKQLNDKMSVCFYVINGYGSQDENVAFEHAFFILEEFIYDLEESTELPDKYLAFADTGEEIDSDEIIGFKNTKAGLKHFDCTLEDLRNARKNIAQEGKIIWEI